MFALRIAEPRPSIFGFREDSENSAFEPGFGMSQFMYVSPRSASEEFNGQHERALGGLGFPGEGFGRDVDRLVRRDKLFAPG